MRCLCILMERSFHGLFPNNDKVVIGMIHLAGRDREERVDRAVKEVMIYKEEGLGGFIVEDYHGDVEDVEAVLEVLSENPTIPTLTRSLAPRILP